MNDLKIFVIHSFCFVARRISCVFFIILDLCVNKGHSGGPFLILHNAPDPVCNQCFLKSSTMIKYAIVTGRNHHGNIQAAITTTNRHKIINPHSISLKLQSYPSLSVFYILTLSSQTPLCICNGEIIA